MDLTSTPPSTSLVKCCDCECSCSLMNCYSGTWLRSVKRKLDEFEENDEFIIPGLDYPQVARIEIGNECDALRQALSSQQQTIQDLSDELEEERNASSSAANETMSMILRLQREKADIQMEARQFKRFVEEKMAHDQEELLMLEDMLYKKEQTIQSLSYEVKAYRHRLMSYGLTESEVDGERDDMTRNNNGMIENIDSQFGLPMYNYPPLRCTLNENHVYAEFDNDVDDIEKYAFGESPHSRESLNDLENRISELERSPRAIQADGEFTVTMNVLEKVIVGESPRKSKHFRKFSADTSKDMCPDLTPDSPKLGSSFQKTEYTQTKEFSNMKSTENISDSGDDMSDRVYTIDSVHHEMPYNDSSDLKASVGICDSYMESPKESLNHVDAADPGIKKLYMRLQALEADRESMRQAIVSMRTDKAQLVLLKEIAQQLCKEMSPARRTIVKKSNTVGSFSFVSIFKWVLSFVFWRKKARQSKYMFGMSANNAGLLMLLDKGGPRMGQLGCVIRAQV